MKKLRNLIVAALMLTSIMIATVAPASAKVNEYEGQHRVAGDPSQWGE
jgi:hypothetical protein